MNYKRLGDYIEISNNRNSQLKYGERDVRGVSNDKKIIGTKANNNGRSFDKFYIVEPNAFIYNSRTSRMGNKVGLGFNETKKTIITSFNNTVFRVKSEFLIPKYLYMWFNRAEFDRYARFNSWGSSTEIFSWEDMQEVKLPIPSIEKQQQIVNEYNTVTNRIQLNQKINTNLEATAQGLYKHWFVDFEFPNQDGKPYKSSGGAMVYNEELDKEIPVGWRVETVKDFSKDMKSGGTPSRSNYQYWNKNDFPWLKTGEIKNNIIIDTSEWISDEGLRNSSAKLLPINTVLMSMYGVNAGEIGFLKFEATTNQACCGVICNNIDEAAFLYYHFLENQEFNHSQAIGGAQQNLSKDYIENIKILIPDINLIENTSFSLFINQKEKLTRQSQTLKELQNLLLAKMTQVGVEDSILTH